MIRSLGPCAGATLTILLGFALAYPFLRTSSRSASVRDAGSVDEVFPPLPADAAAAHAPQRGNTHDSNSIAAARGDDPETTSALPSLFKVELPDWARPPSQLDALIERGSASLAEAPEVEPIQQISTWISQPPRAHASDGRVEALADRQQPPGAQTPSPAEQSDVFAFRASPWDAVVRGDSSAQAQSPERQPGGAFSDQQFMVDDRDRVHFLPPARDGQGRQAQADASIRPAPHQRYLTSQTAVSPRMRQTGASVQAGSGYDLNVHSLGTQPAHSQIGVSPAPASRSRDQPPDDGTPGIPRARHYVYQPGYLPDD